MLKIFLVVSGVAALGTWLLAMYRGKFAPMDEPNERSLHAVSTPRTGGLAILTAMVAGAFMLDRFYAVSIEWRLLAAALPVLLVSLVDDFRHVPALLRLGVHLAAGSWVYFAGGGIDQVSLAGMDIGFGNTGGLILTALFVTWMINLYNFMDGMDGFAGGMAVVGFGCFAVLGMLGSNPSLLAFAGVVAFAAAGFLVFNFPPARIFLGDAGAGLLGFLAAIVILQADRDEVLPLVGGILVFSPFIVDATVTLLRRLWAREAVWQAHRSHLYQRLVASGWSHRRTVLWEYALMLATAISAILLFYNNNPGFELGLFFTWATVYVALVTWVERTTSNR